MRLLGILFSVMLTSAAMAQPYAYKSIRYFMPPSPLISSAFSVDQIKGCAPFKINVYADNVNVTDGGVLRAREPGRVDTLVGKSSSITFYKPGVHYLHFLQFGNGDSGDSIQITVFENIKPSFDVFTCINEVYVKITDTNNYDGGYQLTYPPPAAAIVSPLGQGAVDTHAILGSIDGVSTTYNIKVRGLHVGALNNCYDSTQAVPVLNAFQIPNIDTLKIIDANEIDIKFDDQRFVPYTFNIEQHTNTVKAYTPFVSSVTNVNGLFKVQNSAIKPDLNNNYYCFKITPENKCAGGLQPALTSASLCTVNLKAVAVADQDNLSWTTTAPSVNYDVRRDNVVINSIAAAETTYEDKTSVCNTIYAYKIHANYVGGASVSLPKTVTSFSVKKPNPISYLGSEVGAGGVALAWATDVDIKTYHILKGGSEVGSTNSLTFNDASYAAGNCYQISVENLCGNRSDNALTPDYCPITLTGSISKSNETTLSWSAYPTATTYTIEKINDKGAVVLTITGQTSPYADPAQETDEQVYSYRIIAEGTPLATSSNIFVAVKEPNISYPTAFVPTGSTVPAENSIFKVIGHYVNGFQMRIFNRWGEMMFSTENISEGWDGKYHGLQMPEGTYVFTAVLTDELGRKFNRSGSVVLLRK